VARVVALIPDLLFGSQVQGKLLAAGHAVELVGDMERLAEQAQAADVLVADLTDDLDSAAIVREWYARDAHAGSRTLGFYAHVQPAVRERALQAGFDLVVPRSRMAREGSELVRRLVADGPPP
jgi:hypothetical protein